MARRPSKKSLQERPASASAVCKDTNSSMATMTTMMMIVAVCAQLLSLQSVHAFASPPAASSMSSSTSSRFDRQSIQLEMARVPEISRWKVTRNGAVRGVSKFHPVIDDGEDITTSPLRDPTLCAANKVVKTESGSSYKLVGPNAAPLPKIAQPAPSSINGVNGSVSSGGSGLFGFGGADSKQQQKQQQQQPKVNGSAPAQESQQKAQQQQQSQQETPSLTLKREPKPAEPTAITIGNGAYILAGVASRSTSGKSQIWKAYRADSNGKPVGEELVIKLSSNYDALYRENYNYDTVSPQGLSIGFSGAFCKKYDFLDYAEASKKGFEKQSALVLQSGLVDLKELLRQNREKGLPPKPLRDAAAAAGQCIQAMHAKRMVWTDLKTENFVLVQPPTNSALAVRGIDLESAQPFDDTPSDFSPEACPPEFAEAYLGGKGSEFILKPSYDMWSLGMMLYELSTGKPYFYRQSGTAITTTLRDPNFVADVSAIDNDPKLRELVAKCLERNPNQRPSITAFLLHPYFTTTGIGAWTF